MAISLITSDKYWGTKITGTSTTPKVFKNSGVGYANVGNTYYNTAHWHVYKCTTGGKPSVAKWKYIETLIIEPPSVAVSKLGSPARTTVGNGTHFMKATWSVPKAMLSDSKNNKAEKLSVEWRVGVSGGKDFCIEKKVSTGTEQSQINLSNLTVGSRTYTRASFWPMTKRKLLSVTATVRGWNKVGYGNPANATRVFVPPVAPTISAFSFNADNGHVSATITSDAGAGYAERYDTHYKVYVTDTRTGKSWVATDATSTATSVTAGFDVTDYQQLTYGQYVKITVSAWTRGYAGNSEVVSRSYYVSFPAQTTIRGVDITSKSSSGRCVARINTNNTAAHPVDTVKLEYLANCEYATAASIPGTADWADSGAQDDAQCTALTMPVTELIPEPGNYTWLRVKSHHANEAVLKRYSNYVRLKALETPAPTAEDERITILSATAGADGESVVVHLGWNRSGQADSTGTELSWSEDSDTWKSTEEPESYNFEWSDGAVTVGGVTYHDSATITIKRLEGGRKYYIRARRYLEGDGETSYSPYSNMTTCYTSTAPEAVTATCDRYVPAGRPLSVYWTFSGGSVQKRWQIISSNNKIIASGNGSAGSARISAARLKSVAVNSSLTFTVRVSSGSGFVASESHTVTIVSAPALTLTAPAQMTAQPYSFTAVTSRVSDLIVIVTSTGAMGQYPDGIRLQTAGDTIYSERMQPEWTETADGFTATITLPEGLGFWDGAEYKLAVTAVDRTTELRSEEQVATFSVDWAVKAADPEEVVTLTPIDEVSDDGVHRLAVEIALTPPTGCAETDLFDIYRMDGGTARLIGEGFPLTGTVTDEYAPFGDGELLYYRIALRTQDGDVAFADIEYDLPVDTLRLDWRDGSVELPYNIAVGDGYSKDVELRGHMDGSIDGYWNPNVTRKSSLSTDVITVDQQAEIEAVRRLARYAGPVFVRTPNGGAFEADVQVTNLSANNTHIANIALDANEINLTPEFILPTPYSFEEEG